MAGPMPINASAPPKAPPSPPPKLRSAPRPKKQVPIPAATLPGCSMQVRFEISRGSLCSGWFGEVCTEVTGKAQSSGKGQSGRLPLAEQVRWRSSSGPGVGGRLQTQAISTSGPVSACAVSCVTMCRRAICHGSFPCSMPGWRDPARMTATILMASIRRAAIT